MLHQIKMMLMNYSALVACILTFQRFDRKRTAIADATPRAFFYSVGKTSIDEIIFLQGMYYHRMVINYSPNFQLQKVVLCA